MDGHDRMQPAQWQRVPNVVPQRPAPEFRWACDWQHGRRLGAAKQAEALNWTGRWWRMGRMRSWEVGDENGPSRHWTVGVLPTAGSQRLMQWSLMVGWVRAQNSNNEHRRHSTTRQTLPIL